MLRPSLLSPPSCPLSLLPSHRSHLWNPVSFHPPIRTLFHSSFPVRRPVLAQLSSPRASDAAGAVLGSKKEEEEVKEAKFIEIGYISSTHGLQGKLRVMPSTDFPEIRFAKPGRRWLRMRVYGKEVISEVDLTEGRDNPGQKSWIISLRGVDDVEKAKQIVGSTLLVTEGDRPELEEGEFYTRDLVGMRVVLKETGKLVGTVINVFNYGASDLLQVMLGSTEKSLRRSDSAAQYIDYQGPHVWVPFVEAIVPDVDIERREMHITPPKGLLELNLRSDVRSKKERRQLEWKQRKKLQQRVIAAKKRLSEMDQKHVLEGFRFGGRTQKSLLARQIADINFKLFQHALQSINIPFDRCSLPELVNANSDVLLKNAIRVSRKNLVSHTSEGGNDMNHKLHKEGLRLLTESKAAIIIINDRSNLRRGFGTNDFCFEKLKSMVIQFQESLLDFNRSLKVEEQKVSVPLIMVSPSHEIQSCKEYFSDNGYFGLSSEKVWFLEEEKLPIVSASTTQNEYKMLLNSPWEILQASTGSGGLFSLLSSHKIMDDLHEMGVEYVQVCSLDDRSIIGHPLFFGFVSSCRADIGIKVFEDNQGDGEFDIIFSTRHITKLSKQIDKLQFSAVPEQHVHVELVENEWITVHPDTSNSWRLHCSIYSSLNTTSVDNMSLVLVSD